VAGQKLEFMSGFAGCAAAAAASTVQEALDAVEAAIAAAASDRLRCLPDCKITYKQLRDRLSGLQRDQQQLQAPAGIAAGLDQNNLLQLAMPGEPMFSPT
jgi:hypothetical protein